MDPLSPVVTVIQEAQSVLREDIETISRIGLTQEMYHWYLSFQFSSHQGRPGSDAQVRRTPGPLREAEPAGVSLPLCPGGRAALQGSRARPAEHGSGAHADAARRRALVVVLRPGGGGTTVRLFDEVEFLDRKNTRFLEIHLHEVLPHGDQIVGALRSVPLDTQDVAHLTEGANTGSVTYLRMARWALGLDPLAARFDVSVSMLRAERGVYEDLEDLCTA